MIHDYRSGDHDAIVALSLLAWAPVFASMEAVLGAELARRLHGEDWRTFQAAAVSDTVTSSENRTWVAEADGRVAGFAAATTADSDRRIGEIAMLAVDPVDQRHGLGREVSQYFKVL